MGFFEEDTKGGAVIDGVYRYLLWREWRGTHKVSNWRWNGHDGAGKIIGEPKACLFIMLNPSTADADHDDPTVRRCISFAKAWKYERLEIVNLFAYRTKDPKELFALNHNDDPVGVRNQNYIEDLAYRAGIVIAAWGVHGQYMDQAETVRGWLGSRKLHALKLTKEGFPQHPLYVKGDVTPILLPE